jgi:hypothetical protein
VEACIAAKGTSCRPREHVEDLLKDDDVAPSSPLLQLSWEAADRCPLAAYLAGGALATAASLAILGLPPVDLHGPLHRLGIMDPLCGGTRAVRYAALGDWKASWTYNPLGIAVLLTSVGSLVRTGIGNLSGRWLTVQPANARLVYAALAAILLVLAVRQQLHADLLMSRPQ